MQYPAHAAFVAPARGYPQLWRLVLGIVASVGTFFVMMGLLFGLVSLGPGGIAGAEAWMRSAAAGETPTGTLLLLALYAGLGLGAILAARILHKRAARTLFGPEPPLRRHFLIGLAVAMIVFGFSFFIPSPVQSTRSLDLSIWLTFLPLALLAVLVQTGAEELLFRGYIQQQLAARFSSPLLWMVLPSAIFALLHYDPVTMGDAAWLVVAATGLFGLCAADLTARTGTIGAAWGFHFANNAVAILLLSMEGPLSGLALNTLPPAAEMGDVLRPLLLLDMGVTVAIWFAIRLAVRPAETVRANTGSDLHQNC